MLALYGRTPIFAEKPIVRTENESYALAQRLSHEADARSLSSVLVMRSAPIVREVLSIVHEGHLGQIVSIDATEHLPPEHGAYLARNWRRKREWGGSFLLDKVCHDFDILGEIAGARPQRVVSFGGRGVFRPDRAPARARIRRRHRRRSRRGPAAGRAHDGCVRERRRRDRSSNGADRICQRRAARRSTPTATARCASGAGTSRGPRAR